MFGLIGLSVLTATIVGFVTIIKWLARGGKSTEQIIRQAVNAELQQLLPTLKDEEDKKILGDYLAGTLTGSTMATKPVWMYEPPALGATPKTAPISQTAPVTEALNKNQSIYPETDEKVYRGPNLRQTEPTQATEPFDFDKLLHNANILLYLGAFLMVVAASIFVSGNPELLGGWAKTTIIGVFCLLFYASGLALYTGTKKLKPAGITFTSIGLFTAPLVGLAAYSFGLEKTGAEAVWFVTSAVTLLMHLVSLFIIKRSYISYLSAFTTLSLFLSLVSVLNMPVYWFGWVMTITSLPMLFLARTKTNQSELLQPFRVSAHIFIPASLLLSLLFGVDMGWWQAGVNFLLAGIFYLTGAWVKSFDGSSDEVLYFQLAALAVPIGVGLIAFEQTPLILSISLLVVGSLYALLSEFLPKSWVLAHKTALLYLGGSTCFVAILFVANQPMEFFYIILASSLINGYMFARQHLAYHQVLCLIGVFLMPYVFLGQIITTPLSTAGFAWVYLLLGVMLGLLSYFGPWKDDETNVTFTKAFYLLGFIIAFVLSLSGSNELVAASITSCLLLVFAIISYLEKQASVLFVSVVLSYLGLWQWFEVANLTNIYLVYGYLLLGAMWLTIRLVASKPLLNSLQVFQIGYTGAWLLALLLVLNGSPVQIFTVSAILTLVTFGLSYLERNPQIVAISTVLSFVAVLQLPAMVDAELTFNMVLLFWGLALFGFSFAVDKLRGQWLRMGGLAGTYGATLADTNLNEFNQKAYLPVLANFAAGGLTLVEAVIRRQASLAYVGSVVLLATILRTYSFFDIEETQVYTVTIALYFAGLAYLQHRHNQLQNRDLFTVLALGFLTLPTFSSSVNDTAGGYSILLIAESILLIAAGMLMSYRLVTYWGVISLMIVVFYQLHDVLLNVPTWAIYGLVGLGMLAGAIYLLSKHSDNSDQKLS
jgi:hypothetical protein